MYFDDVDDDYAGWNLYDSKRSSPKKGRRAGETHSDASPQVDSLDSPFKGLDIKGFVGETAPPKPPRANVGGWAETSSKFHQSSESEEGSSKKLQDEENDNVMSIPDLDDFKEDDFISQVAKAPNVNMNRVATFKELDNDLHHHAAFATLNDIDLKALTRFMLLESEVKDDDVPWTWEVLSTDVTSNFHLQQSLVEDDEMISI